MSKRRREMILGDAPPDYFCSKYNRLVDFCDHKENIDLKDPSPWCSHCGAMTYKQCNCGPIAENE